MIALRQIWLVMALAPLLLVLGATAEAQQEHLRKPVPAGVVQILNTGITSLVELHDGTLLANNGRISKDGGRSWSDPRPLGAGVSGDGFVRLKSGALMLTGDGKVRVSRDEGKTWSEPVVVYPKLEAQDGTLLFNPGFLPDAVIQLGSGRLVYAGDWSGAGRHAELDYKSVSAWGSWKGKRVQIEGHGHFPETGGTLIAYSDDEGKSWKFAEGMSKSWGFGKFPNTLMGWFDEMGNVRSERSRVACIGETTMAETKDGKILLVAYPYASRVLHSWSSNGGEDWTPVAPMKLASSVSPSRLRRIPKTGDLLMVWNQVSREEIRRGYRRGRLTAAISKDGGQTWENFKTLELSEGLEDVARIPEEFPVDLPLARPDVGDLPEGWAFFHYANVCFVGDKVFLTYSRGWPKMGVAEMALTKQEHVLRIYPLEWFYQ